MLGEKQRKGKDELTGWGQIIWRRKDGELSIQTTWSPAGEWSWMGGCLACVRMRAPSQGTTMSGHTDQDHRL